jgi:diadenylate cyclase
VEEVLRPITALRNLTASEIFINLLDVALVAFLIYRLLLLVRGTRAWRILIGVIAFLIVLVLSDRFGLNTLHWILDKATILGPVALVILFLPEVRQAIEGFGKITPLQMIHVPGSGEERAEARTVEEICSAVAELQQESIGALIVIERTAKLDEIISNGVALNARVSAPLLGSIFYGENPLHDGAVILRGDIVMAAACRLPLSENPRLDSHLHMRHRAAVGISEQTDAFTITVSEERGTISVANDGELRRLNTVPELRDLLNRELRKMPHTPGTPKAAKKSRRRVRTR